MNETSSENRAGAAANGCPLVYAIILNTNKREDTLACLRSLRDTTYPNLRILVLDNRSTDGSVEAIRAEFPRVDVHILEENKGYAGNNNVGMRMALEQGADWLYVLNEDTVSAPDSISRLVDAAESMPGVGIAGPMVYHHNEPGVIQSAGGGFDALRRSFHHGINETDRGQYPADREVEWISGCAILLKADALRQAGLIDERFFYYYEETELCYRIHKLGWKVLHVPQAKLWHKGVQRDYQPSPNVSYYSTRNYFLFLKKHGAPLSVWLKAWAQTLRTIVSYTVRPKWRGKRAHRDASLQGALDFVFQRWGKREER